MPNILDEIVAAKRVELAESKAQVSLSDLEAAAASQPRPLNLSGALLGGGVRLIAEVKKASPSRGLLMPDFDRLKLAETYAGNGAAAISCLTDARFQCSWAAASSSFNWAGSRMATMSSSASAPAALVSMIW